MKELKRADLSLENKQDLIQDQLSKFESNIPSKENSPYNRCPNALTKKFEHTPVENEGYHKILQSLSDELISEENKRATPSWTSTSTEQKNNENTQAAPNDKQSSTHEDSSTHLYSG